MCGPAVVPRQVVLHALINEAVIIIITLITPACAFISLQQQADSRHCSLLSNVWSSCDCMPDRASCPHQ